MLNYLKFEMKMIYNFTYLHDGLHVSIISESKEYRVLKDKYYLRKKKKKNPNLSGTLYLSACTRVLREILVRPGRHAINWTWSY